MLDEETCFPHSSPPNTAVFSQLGALQSIRSSYEIISSYLLMTTGLLSLDNLGASALQVVAILTISALQRAVIP
jgi:hypothetical protein